MDGQDFGCSSPSAPSPAQVGTIKVYYGGVCLCRKTTTDKKNGLQPPEPVWAEKQFGICPMRSFPLDLMGIIFNSTVGES